MPLNNNEQNNNTNFFEVIGENYLRLKTLTVVPIQANILKKELMTQTEIKWLNEYNERCLKTLKPLLLEKKNNNGEAADIDDAIDYLERTCKSI